jgi:hypothetical protein
MVNNRVLYALEDAARSSTKTGLKVLIAHR